MKNIFFECFVSLLVCFCLFLYFLVISLDVFVSASSLMPLTEYHAALVTVISFYSAFSCFPFIFIYRNVEG